MSRAGGAAVPTMVALLERSPEACPFWPAAPVGFYLPVPRHPTPDEVGAIVWALVGYHATDDDGAVTVTDAREAVEAYLASEESYAAGGLRVTDGTVVVDPGCCVGLDEWRAWRGALHGQVPDLGHDPNVFVEDRGPVLRLWQDVGLLPAGAPLPREGPYLDIPREAFPDLLRGVQRDLTGFLAALRPWAGRQVGDELADLLVATVDERLEITAPLPV